MRLETPTVSALPPSVIIVDALERFWTVFKLLTPCATIPEKMLSPRDVPAFSDTPRVFLAVASVESLIELLLIEVRLAWVTRRRF